MNIHDTAQKGFSAAAQTYSSGRPDYPAQLTTWLRDKLNLRPGRRVLDLGAGTGKFTAQLVQTGAEVFAVEPVDEMRAELARRLPSVHALKGPAEEIPLDDGAVDAVVCAQAFHWFASERALAEIHRVLAPGGVLGLVWNMRDESVDWVDAATKIIEPYEGDAPRVYSGAWREAFATGRYFDLPEPAVFTHRHEGNPEDVIVKRNLSVSFIAALPESERDKVAARLREMIATCPELSGRETVAFPYRTEAYTCVRRDLP